MGTGRHWLVNAWTPAKRSGARGSQTLEHSQCSDQGMTMRPREPFQYVWLIPLVPLALAVLCATTFVGVLCFSIVRALIRLYPENPIDAVFYGSLFGAILFAAITWGVMAWRDSH